MVHGGIDTPPALVVAARSDEARLPAESLQVPRHVERRATQHFGLAVEDVVEGFPENDGPRHRHCVVHGLSYGGSEGRRFRAEPIE